MSIGEHVSMVAAANARVARLVVAPRAGPGACSRTRRILRLGMPPVSGSHGFVCRLWYPNYAGAVFSAVRGSQEVLHLKLRSRALRLRGVRHCRRRVGRARRVDTCAGRGRVVSRRETHLSAMFCARW